MRIPRFLRANQIIGDPNAIPPIEPIIPVKKSTWWNGVRSGRYPKPYKISEKCVAWLEDDIADLVESIKTEKGSRNVCL